MFVFVGGLCCFVLQACIFQYTVSQTIPTAGNTPQSLQKRKKQPLQSSKMSLGWKVGVLCTFLTISHCSVKNTSFPSRRLPLILFYPPFYRHRWQMTQTLSLITLTECSWTNDHQLLILVKCHECHKLLYFCCINYQLDIRIILKQGLLKLYCQVRRFS